MYALLPQSATGDADARRATHRDVVGEIDL